MYIERTETEFSSVASSAPSVLDCGLYQLWLLRNRYLHSVTCFTCWYLQSKYEEEFKTPSDQSIWNQFFLSSKRRWIVSQQKQKVWLDHQVLWQCVDCRYVFSYDLTWLINLMLTSLLKHVACLLHSERAEWLASTSARRMPPAPFWAPHNLGHCHRRTRVISLPSPSVPRPDV